MKQTQTQRQVQAYADKLGINVANATMAAYEIGLEEGQEIAQNANGITENLKQIDRMARQIEECHSTIRRRNLEIRELSIQVQNLKKCKCNE